MLDLVGEMEGGVRIGLKQKIMTDVFAAIYRPLSMTEMALLKSRGGRPRQVLNRDL